MRTKTTNRTPRKTAPLAILIIGTAGLLLPAAAQSKQGYAQPTGKAFATPDEAAQAIVLAARTYDISALLEILGQDAKDLVVSDDPTLDKNRAVAFATLALEKMSVQVDPKHPTRAEITVGQDEFPSPIPIVKTKGKWYFDTKAGRQEILFRRIGENELDAIRICRGFVEAQQEYALTSHGDLMMAQYAQKIISSPGSHDGLAWQNPDGSWGGPVGESIARALQEGYSSDKPPFHGYYFKVLKGQGPAAPFGAMNFMVNGAMIGGFALIAAPAQYRVTGVETFIVSQDGIVYQKDLGPNTLTTFKAIDLYNPDKTWRWVDDEP